MDGGGGGVSRQPHTPASSTPRKDPVPIVQEAGWAPGPVWTGGKYCLHRDLIPDRPAHGQSLSRLSCSTHYCHLNFINNSSCQHCCTVSTYVEKNAHSILFWKKSLGNDGKVKKSKLTLQHAMKTLREGARPITLLFL